MWIVEVNENGASEPTIVGLEFGIKYQANLTDREPVTYAYTQGFSLENYQVRLSLRAIIHKEHFLSFSGLQKFTKIS